MTQITITSNVGLVRQGLQDLAAEIPKIGRRKIYDAINRITREMEGYPAELPMQTYRRTGRLGASWKVQSLEDGYSISNYAAKKGRRYANYVVGNAYGTGQAQIHEGRWPLFRDVVDREIAKQPQEIVDEIDLVARRVLPK